MSDKVRNGTPYGCSSICNTCRNAQVVRGINLQEFIYCGSLGRAVRFPVERCTMYDDSRGPSLQRMREIAWEVTSRSRGPVGFSGGSGLEIVIQPPSFPNYGVPAQPASPATAISGAEARRMGMKAPEGDEE